MNWRRLVLVLGSCSVLAAGCGDDGPTSTGPTGHWEAIGNLNNILDSWTRLINYNRGIMFTWAKNSVTYVTSALALCMAITIPAGYLLANVAGWK